jgi:hypothetical protein
VAFLGKEKGRLVVQSAEAEVAQVKQGSRTVIWSVMLIEMDQDLAGESRKE